MFKIFSRKSEIQLSTLARTAQIESVLEKGKYSNFLIILNDKSALNQKTFTQESIDEFVNIVEGRIAKDDFDSPIQTNGNNTASEKATAPRLVIFVPQNKSDKPKLLFRWPPEQATPAFCEELSISFFNIKIEGETEKYRYKLIAIDSRTNQFAFSYGVEKSPFLECIVCINADGTRINFGENTVIDNSETFKRLAIEFAIKKIYDDQLVNPSVLNTLGVTALAAKLQRAGMQLLSINKDCDDGPQIFGIQDGNSIAVIVRADIYPYSGELTDRTEEEVFSLIANYQERKHDLYYASVTIVNADARNEYEKSALLRNSSYSMTVSQFGPIEECEVAPGLGY